MKNFPHQYARLDKLTDALRVAASVIDIGDNLDDDAEFGEALARAGLYTDRTGGNVEQMLRRERQKPASSQGTRTAAREIRRTLQVCGFLLLESEWRVTARGREVLGATGDAVLHALWRDAMLALALVDAGGAVSHPYRILLRLVSDNPGIESRKLLLALEARDDSAAEYRRVSRLADMKFDTIRQKLAISEANAANAVKILPSIAVQVGDLTKSLNLAYPLAFPVVAEDGLEPATAKAAARGATPARRKMGSKSVTAATIAATPAYGEVGDTMIDLADSIALRQRRTAQHQTLVRRMAATLEAAGFTLFENPFDCLARRRRIALLFEAKTLDGSPSDERRQAEKALGQIRGYAHFDIPEDVSDAGLRQIVLFSEQPSEEMVAFLKGNAVEVVWPEGDAWQASDPGGHFDPDAAP